MLRAIMTHLVRGDEPDHPLNSQQADSLDAAAADLDAGAGSLVGGRVASTVDPRRLTIAFAVLLIVVALYTAARSLGLVG